MSKQILTLTLLVSALILGLTACGGTPVPTLEPPTAAPTIAATAVSTVAPTAVVTATVATTTTQALKIGMVTDVGKVDDKSFNQTAWEGVQKAKKELQGITEIKYIETTDSKDYGKNIAQFADAGYDVIVTVGFNLTEDTYAAAKKYPKIKFIGIDQFLSKDDKHADWPLSNLTGIVFEEDKAGFMAGALAASVSKTGTVGSVLGTDAVPPVWRYGEGYRAGATYVKKDIKVLVTYHNDVGFDKTFSDPEWGKTTALSMIDKGADVIFGAGGKTGNGSLQGAAGKAGIYCIGVDTDQYYTVPEAAKCMISSAMKLETPSVFATIKSIVDGTWKPGLYTGPIDLAPFHDFDSKIPADVKQKMQDINKGLQDGTIKTNVPPVKPSK